MAVLNIPTTHVAGLLAKASELNNNFLAVKSWSLLLDYDNFTVPISGALNFTVSTTKAVNIVNNGNFASILVTNNANARSLEIVNTAQLAAGNAAILITDAVAQVTATSAELKMALSASATIPAIEILHGANTTFQVKATHLVVPSKTTTERDAIVAAPVASVLFNSTVQELQFNTSSGWAQSVPTGSVQTFAGFIFPTGWLLCDGTAVSRATYAALLAVLSKSSSGDISGTTNRISNILAGGTTNIQVGWYISGPGIPALTTVTAVNAIPNSLDLSQNTTVLATGAAFTAAPHGIGDGSTTFNVPDCRGIFIRGAGTQTIQGKIISSSFAAKLKDTTAVNGLSVVDAGHSHLAGQPMIENNPYGLGVGVYGSVAIGGGAAAGGGYQIPGTRYLFPTSTNTAVLTPASSNTETAPGSITLNYIIKT